MVAQVTTQGKHSMLGKGVVLLLLMVCAMGESRTRFSSQFMATVILND